VTLPVAALAAARERAAPPAVAAVLVPFRASLPNTDAALALVLVVVAVAAAGRRLAGVLAAVSAAAWFDFFLTVPYERFTMTRRPDVETTALILAVGIAVPDRGVQCRPQGGEHPPRGCLRHPLREQPRERLSHPAGVQLPQQHASEDPPQVLADVALVYPPSTVAQPRPSSRPTHRATARRCTRPLPARPARGR